MDLVPLSLLIPSALLLLWAERVLKLPTPVHAAVVLLLGASLCAVVAATGKRRRMRHEKRLQELRRELDRCTRRYQGILEGAGNALFIFNADSGVLEESNSAAQELLGFSPDEMATMKGMELFPHGEKEKFRSLVYRLKRRGNADAVALTFQRKDGSLFLGQIEARFLELESERLVAAIVRDISEKRRAQEELTQRNRELIILNGILTGLNEGDALDSVLETTLTQLMEVMGAQGGAIHLTEERALPAVSVSRSVPPHFAGELAGCIERGMEECRSIATCDGQGRGCCRLARSAHEEGWGRLSAVQLTTHTRLIGVMHLLHREWRPYTEEEIRFLITVGKQVGNALEHARLFTELDWKSAELLRSHQLLEKNSRNLAASEIKLKQNLTLVEQAHADLRRLSTMKNQFLGLVSHEFNTPLTSIIAGTELLIQLGHGGEEGEVLDMVRSGGMRLKDLVADLLKLIRLEAREGELNRAPVHLRGQLEILKEQLDPVLTARGQKLTLCELDALPYFQGDWSYLERVFSELIENAIKFTPDGGEITVRGRVVDHAVLAPRKETLERFHEGFLTRCGDRCYLEVEVSDNGIGIPHEEQVGIFQIFYEIGDIRHHSSGRHKFQGKGAGLGLALVKGMVEAHGGMVWVESVQGSSFFVLLPLEQELTQPELF